MGETISYVRAHAGIGPLFVILAVASTFIRPLQDMLPGFAGGVFGTGASGLAWLTASMGVGATISAAWIAIYGRLSGLTMAVLLGCLGQALTTLGFVATDNFWVAVVFALFWGTCLNVMGTCTQALVQTAVDDNIRGRVMGLYTLIYRGTPAIGALLVGTLAEGLGLRLTFAIAALFCLAAWAAALPRRETMTASLEVDHR